MAKKIVDPKTIALETLAQSLADPTSKVLISSGKAPGFFKGSAQEVKEAAKLCEDSQWVVGAGEWAGTGKNKKQKYRLTPAGIQAVLEHSDTLVLLRGLGSSLQQQIDFFQGQRDQLGLLLTHFKVLADKVQELTLRVEPPDIEQILRNLSQTPPAEKPASSPTVGHPQGGNAGWLEEVVRLVAEQKQRDLFQPLTLPALFRKIGEKQPGLTLGQFHDGLRALKDQKRIRLTPYTRALATIDDPRNALFLDGEVMYYAELP